MSLYEIAFSGQLLPGARLEQVEANLSKLFQADAQRIAQLFSGRRIVIKQNLDFAAVEKYRQAMERAGAQVEVRPMPVDVEEIELAPPPVEAAPVPSESAAAPQPLKVAPRDEYMAAFVDVEAPDFGIAPVGADLQDTRAPVQTPTLDLSQFSLAPLGSDMSERRRATDLPAPDTSHLKLAD
ncbi:membrane protein [Stutzerimonas stutzeri]|nr:membrane protein [Stutzerimonas stutzeri]